MKFIVQDIEMVGYKDQGMKLTSQKLKAIIKITSSPKTFLPNFFIAIKKRIEPHRFSASILPVTSGLVLHPIHSLADSDSLN